MLQERRKKLLSQLWNEVLWRVPALKDVNKLAKEPVEKKAEWKSISKLAKKEAKLLKKHKLKHKNETEKNFGALTQNVVGTSFFTARLASDDENDLYKVTFDFCKDFALIKDVAYIDYNMFNESSKFLELDPIGDYFVDMFIVHTPPHLERHEVKNILECAATPFGFRVSTIFAKGTVKIEARDSAL